MIYFLIYLFLEIFVSMEIASYIGVLATFLEVILSAVIGIFIIINFKYSLMESVVSLLQKEVTKEEFISMHLFSLVGAIFLILPGFLLDIVGILMQFEDIAKLISSRLFRNRFKSRFNYKKKGDENVIDVEVIEHN